jgi:hydroxymethylbilane synthase
LRPDLRIVPLRGNVTTRLEKIQRGDADATLMAAAGLRRLELAGAITVILPPEQITPPMGQGALGIEARAGEFAAVWAVLEDPRTRQAVDAERCYLARVGGGCRTPVGILAQPLDAGGWRMTAMLASADGRDLLRRQIEIPADSDPCDAARTLAEQMLASAPASILSMLNGAPGS